MNKKLFTTIKYHTRKHSLHHETFNQSSFVSGLINPLFQCLSLTQKAWLSWTHLWVLTLYPGNTGPEHICIQPKLHTRTANGQCTDPWRWMKAKFGLITSLSPQDNWSTALLCHLSPHTVCTLTWAFHFHVFLFFTRQTFPASPLSSKLYLSHWVFLDMLDSCCCSPLFTTSYITSKSRIMHKIVLDSLKKTYFPLFLHTKRQFVSSQTLQ